MFINNLDKMLGDKDEFENSQIKALQKRNLAESLTEIIDRIVSPFDLDKLTDKQINYLHVLKNRWTHEKVSTDTISEIKSVLGIISREVDKKDGYLINKGLK